MPETNFTLMYLNRISNQEWEEILDGIVQSKKHITETEVYKESLIYISAAATAYFANLRNPPTPVAKRYIADKLAAHISYPEKLSGAAARLSHKFRGNLGTSRREAIERIARYIRDVYGTMAYFATNKPIHRRFR